MRLRRDETHAAARAGEVLRGDCQGVHIFLCWNDVERQLECGGVVPGQFANADYLVDFEVWLGLDPMPRVHMERAFKTESQARAHFAFVRQLVAVTPPDVFRETATLCDGALT